MLRIAIGVLGILLIALGFSSESTLSWFKQKVTSPFSSTPTLSVGNPIGIQANGVTPSVADSGVATLETLSTTAESTVSDGLAKGEELVVAAAVGSEAPKPSAVAEAKEESPQIEIVPAVAATTDAPKDTAIDAVMKKAAAANDDTLFVLKDKVNLRKGPSIEHPIVLQLEKGQELMEFKRDGKWVHVGAYGTEGTVGWVHRTLVGTTQ